MWKRFWNKEGPGRPAPKGGIRGYLYLIYTYFWQMLFLNLCFALACLTVVLIPAALTAMDRVYVKLVKDGCTLIWEEFWDEFKGSWKKSIRAGALFALTLLLSYYLMSLSYSEGMSVFGFTTGVIGLILLLLAVILGSYTFILIAVQDLPLGQILRNARILSAVCFWQSAGIAALVLLFFSIALIHPLVFLGIFVLGGFSILQYSICWIATGPLLRYVLKREGETQG